MSRRAEEKDFKSGDSDQPDAGDLQDIQTMASGMLDSPKQAKVL